ncbi:MAG: acyl carrier protein [Thermoleophilaceae bacterium]
MSAASSLSFERFAVHVAEELSLNPGDFVREARLAEDLSLDSFDMVQVLMRIEELGVRLPDEAVMEIRTVGELYDQYLTEANRAESDMPDKLAGSPPCHDSLAAPPRAEDSL